MKIEVSRHITTIELRRLLQECEFKPYQQYEIFPVSILNEYHRRKIIKLTKNQNSIQLLVVYKKRVLVGLAIIERLPWESTYFGIGMGKIAYLLVPRINQVEYQIKEGLFRGILNICCKIGIKHLCFETDARDTNSIHVAEANDFRLMREQLNYFCEKIERSKLYNLDDNWTIRLYQKSDLIPVLRIATRSEVMSRYHTDSRLSKSRIKQYYRTKVKSYCLGGIDKIFILEKNSCILGFAIYRYEEIARGFMLAYGLFSAISPKVQNRGIGIAFINETRRKALKEANIVAGRVHIANLPMVRILNKIGARFACSIYTFHRWL